MNDYTQTPNLGLYKPEVNADYDLWGDHLNANSDILDGILQAKAVVSDTAPANPRPGDLWFDTVNAQLYVWYVDPTSAQWVIATAQNSAALVSDIPPSNPTKGQFWFDGVGVQLYVWYVDPTGPGQWVPASVSPGGGMTEAPTDGAVYGRQGSTTSWSAVLPMSGGTMNGPPTVPGNIGIFAGDAYPGMRAGGAARTWVGMTDAMTYFDTRSMAAFYSDSGQMPLVAATRASDVIDAFSAPLAISAFGLADKAGGPGIECFYASARRMPGAGGAFGAEFTMGNLGNSVACNPYQAGLTGTTAGLWLSNGSEAAQFGSTINPASTAIGIVSNGLAYTPGATWNKGIVFAQLALTANPYGNRIAIDMAASHEINWAIGGSDARGAFLRSDATAQGVGIVFNNTGMVIASAVLGAETPLLTVQIGGTTILDGVAAPGVHAGRRVNGTVASPTPLAANDAMVQLTAFGWHSGAAYTTTGRALLVGRAAEAWTPTAQGALWEFLTTPTGSITPAIAARLLGRGAFLLGTTTDNNVDLLQINGTITCTNIRTSGYTVATLPPAAGNGGRRVYVTDATAPTFGATVAGGGAVVIPVFSNGANWIVG